MIDDIVAWRLRGWQWVLVDCVVAATLTVGYSATAWGLALSAPACLPLAVRRHLPTTVCCVVLAVTATEAVWGLAKVPYIALAYALYPVAARGSVRTAALAMAGAAVDVVFYVMVDPTLPAVSSRLSAISGSATTICAAFVLGMAVRAQRHYVAGIRDQARQREAEVRAEAARAATEHRLRIARELHDIVAHGLGVIAVQAGVAHYLLDERPDRVGDALDVIETTSRAALGDMRHLLRVLREDDGPLHLAPMPGLADLDGLLARMSQAGTTAEIEVSGRQRALPKGVDATAYRIVQEALTNVIKHAGPAHCTVRIHYGEEELAIDVLDDGPGSTTSATGGHGLIGMRERVSAYGGQLTAGPLAERGFHVRAQIPVAP